MPTANEQLRDSAIRHAHWLARFGGATANRILELINASDADLVDKIAARLAKIEQRGFDLGPATTERLKRLGNEIKVLNRDLHVALGRQLREDLVELAEAEVDIASRRLDEAVGVDLGNLRPSPELLRAAVTDPFQGRVLRDWVRDLEETKAKRLRDAINIGMVEGETTDEIVRRIRGTRANQFRDGILETSRRGAVAITRTAVNHVANRSRDLLYESNRDIIKRLQWVSTLDGRTTPIC